MNIAPNYPYNNDNRNLIDFHLSQIKGKLDKERDYIQSLEEEIYRLNKQNIELKEKLIELSETIK